MSSSKDEEEDRDNSINVEHNILPQTQPLPNNNVPPKQDDLLDSDTDSDYSYSSSDSESDTDPTNPKKPKHIYERPGEYLDIPESDNSESANIARFTRALNSRRYRRAEAEEDREYVHGDDLFDFPKDKENWREMDNQELWADAPLAATKPGWDPVWADEEDWKVVENMVREGKDPPIAPFYLPYRKHYPVIPDNHYDISTPKAVIEELDRIEEFLRWVSYIFPDGSSYEGTVWDDLAHGRGVFVGDQGLVRYEGEWLQNQMEGHGVVEVDIPDIEPIPGSKLEAEMRAEGKIIKRDFMTPEDREWLEMDIEDSVRLTDGNYEIPWYENEEWVRQFGQKPEKGRYKYAGQWKHGRMHGCGVYELNEQTIYGRFYFGELIRDDPAGCDEKISMMHGALAEVASAKARMFINKPDGMVREERGPYGDPQHPYFYEEEDVWQAPGFINQFYEVPDYWKMYVHEVDIEREMWLNSFYRTPLRIPMPAELEYWWENDRPPEFVLINKEPEPDPEDPTQLIYTEDPVILHTPTGRIINYIDDEDSPTGIRMFWQPELKEGEEMDPSKVQFLPLGFDDFYGVEDEEPKRNFLYRVVSSVEGKVKPWLDNLEKWMEEQKKSSEIRKALWKQELELIEAEITLEETLEDIEEDLKRQEKEAAKRDDSDIQDEDENATGSPSTLNDQEEKVSQPEKNEVEDKNDDDDDDDDDEEEEEDDSAPASFGTAVDTGSAKDKKNGPGNSPFSSLSVASSGLLSTVPSGLERSFSMWKKERCPPKVQTQSSGTSQGCVNCPESLTFPQSFLKNTSLRMKSQPDRKLRVKQVKKSTTTSRISSSCGAKVHQTGHDFSRLHWLHAPPETNSDMVLSLSMPVQCPSSVHKC